MMDPASCAQRPRARRYEFTTRPDGPAAGRLAIHASPLAPVPDPRGRIVLSGGGLG
jgi:hypothetical protein